MNKPELISPLSSSGRTPAVTTTQPLTGHGIRACRWHWHVCIYSGGVEGEDLMIPGDPFSTREAALDAADRLNRGESLALVAASPEGSAGLDAEKKKVLAAIIGGGISAPDEHGVRVICLGYHPEQDEYEWLRVVPESSLIDAAKERDAFRERLATTCGELLVARAQLTDARSRISELETAADLADKKRHDAFDQLEALRLSREQAIAAIEALPAVETAAGNFIAGALDRSAVLSILRGAE